MGRVHKTGCVTNERGQPSRMPWVNAVMCDGCAGCVQQCPLGVLKMVETNIEGVFVPWLDDPEACTGCGRCVRGCVSGAIQMTAYVGRAQARFKEKRPVIPV
jgi:Na+-translocating ferredoxin:NAD+ oxidoreductase RNF subunit RnfB